MSEEPLDAGHIFKHHGWWPHKTPWAPDLERCRHAVHDGGRSCGFHQCNKKAKVFREAKWHGKVETFGYCGTHDPVAVAQKKAERDAKWKAQWDAQQAAAQAKRDARELAERSIEALRQIAAGHNDPRSLAIEVLGGHP